MVGEWVVLVVVVCKPIFVSIQTRLRLVAVVLSLSWGCDKRKTYQRYMILKFRGPTGPPEILAPAGGFPTLLRLF